jgi:hypothetical protein
MDAAIRRVRQARRLRPRCSPRRARQVDRRRRFRRPTADVMAAADDDRPYVRKGASWALRQIGKRSDPLRARVLDTVTPCIDSDSRGVGWVARDVSRELLGPGGRRRRTDRRQDSPNTISASGRSRAEVVIPALGTSELGPESSGRAGHWRADEFHLAKRPRPLSAAAAVSSGMSRAIAAAASSAAFVNAGRASSSWRAEAMSSREESAGR